MNKLRQDLHMHDDIPALPQGARFLPIVKQLSFERKLDALIAVNDDEEAACALTQILCKGGNEEELDIFETLSELWKIVENNDREELIMDMRHKTDLAVIIRAALTGPVKMMKLKRNDRDPARQI